MRFRFWSALFLVCLLMVCLPWEGNRAQTAQVSDPPLTRLEGAEGNFIITRGADGLSCRRMSREEAEALRVDRGRGELRDLTEGRSLRLEAQQTGLKIVLRGTSQLENNAQAKEAFLRAAAYWESVIRTPITVIIDVDFGTTLFGTPYPSPDVIGATSNQVLGSSNLYAPLRGQLIAGADNPQQTAIFNALPAGTLPTELGATTGVFTTSPILRALGFLQPSADPVTEAGFGAPPSIGFNSNFPFDFDPSNGIDFEKIDFNATAIHELGHVLGFSSFVGELERAPTQSLAVNVWDLYRFRPGVTSANFSTAQRLLLAGGEHVHFAGLNESQLSTARLDGQGGDGRQSSHWKDDALIGQFIGIMDPTLASGLRVEATAEDLLTLGHFGYGINSAATVTERLTVDDNTRNSTPVATGALIVNRLTPTRYPATVKSLQIVIPIVTGQPSPAGASLRVVVFQDPNQTGQPPANPQFLFNQVLTIPNVTTSRFVEFAFNGPTINSGDFYIGVQATTTAVGIPIDTDGPDAKRSFVSQNNGASFQPLNTLTGGSGSANFMARAIVSAPFDNLPAPTVTAVSPGVIAPGGPGGTIFVQGANFQANSVVRWNNNDRQTTLVSGSLLQATVTAADIANAGTAIVTVFSPAPGGGTSSPLTVTIGTGSALPAINRLDPSSGPLGSQGLTLNVYGRNFTESSRIRVNGNDRTTTFVNSVQVATTLPASDFLLINPLVISVANPGAGGGVSNELSFNVNFCNYSISTSSQSATAAGGSNGVTLTTNGGCPWTVASDASWILIQRPLSASGAGKFVVGYNILANAGPDQREGRVTIGGQILVIRQAGLLTSVSAASFGGALAAESIVAGFGSGLSIATQSVLTLPLPTNLAGTTISIRDARGVTRLAPLFYVSPQQVNYLMPAGTASGTATVTLAVNGSTASTGAINVTTVAPAIFTFNATGKDVAAGELIRVRNGVQTREPIANFDQAQQKFVAVPIDLGPETDQVFLVLYGSGIRGRTSLGAVTVKVGDVDLTPTFAGTQPDYVGLDQVNVLLPRSLKGKGAVNVSLVVNNQPSNTVSINIQ